MKIKTISVLLAVLILGACERPEPDPNDADDQRIWSMGSKLKVQTSERIRQRKHHDPDRMVCERRDRIKQ